MSGSVIGGKKAAKRNKEKYGDNFYELIGSKGGKKGKTGGFASTAIGKDGLTGRQRACKVGVLGGTVSRRTSR